MSDGDWTATEAAKDAAILARRAADLLGRGLEKDFGLLEVLFEFGVDIFGRLYGFVGGRRGQEGSCEQDGGSGVGHMKSEGLGKRVVI